MPWKINRGGRNSTRLAVAGEEMISTISINSRPNWSNKRQLVKRPRSLECKVGKLRRQRGINSMVKVKTTTFARGKLKNGREGENSGSDGEKMTRAAGKSMARELWL